MTQEEITTNTEVTEGNEEEIVVEEEEEESTDWGEADEGEADTEDDVDGDEPETDDEKEALRKELDELKNKNQKLYQKLKSGYKKGAEIKKDYVSKDDVEQIIRKVQTEKEQEISFVSKYEDASDYLPEIKKVMKEDGISIDKAYALVKGKMLFDEAYKNQLLESRTWNHWDLVKKQSSRADDIFSKWPKISMIGK